MPEFSRLAVAAVQYSCSYFKIHLCGLVWLANDYSIADIANWCWVRTHAWSGVSTSGLDHLERWLTQMEQQPGMIDGIAIPYSQDKLLVEHNEEEKKDFLSTAREMLQE